MSENGTEPDSRWIVEVFPVGLLQCNCVVLGDREKGEAIVVDPGGDIEKVREALRRHGLRCTAIVNTHTHIDHVGANAELRDAENAPLMLHEADLPLYQSLAQQSSWLGGMLPTPVLSEVDELIHQGDVVRAGELAASVLHTPGHTPGSLCLHLADHGLVISGDTLFSGSVGRTDLPGGDYEMEIASIRERLLTLDDETRVIPGHGPLTSIGRERLVNPFLARPPGKLSP